MKQDVRHQMNLGAMIMPEVERPSIPKRSVNIADFGAVGDGVQDNTEAIRKAILHISELGGGTVNIPAGVWVTGPIELQSRIELRTEPGTLVLFSLTIIP